MPEVSDLRHQPFLRWLGGKRFLARAIVEHFPSDCGTYYEPFLGSGAVFFRYGAASATLSDTNDELVNAYRVVRDRIEELIDWLGGQPQSEHHYYRLRSACLREEVERAGRFIYLNRTAFNGVWRVNRRGEFNVPYGHRVVMDLVRADRLRDASVALSQVKLDVGDFAASIDESGARRRRLCRPTLHGSTQQQWLYPLQRKTVLLARSGPASESRECSGRAGGVCWRIQRRTR